MKTKAIIHPPHSIRTEEHMDDVVSRLNIHVPDLMPMAFVGYANIAPLYAYFKGFLSAKKKADKEHFVEGMKQVCDSVDKVLGEKNVRIGYDLKKGKYGWAWYEKAEANESTCYNTRHED